MHQLAIQIFQWLEDSSFAAAIRQSNWLYPALEIVHIIGIVLVVGPAFMFDLRLLGMGTILPVDLLGRFLLRWSRRGLLAVVPSGVFLFITNATTLASDPVFWTKILMLLIAAANALLFERFTLPSVLNTQPGQGIVMRARWAAIASLVLWMIIICCGRLLAY